MIPRDVETLEPVRATRWQPSRAGILNVWRYYDETFTFHHGRLLIRGPNGSGKSKALELLLPFLLDADTHAHRLSTFGNSVRTMHWNMMGEGAMGKTRVGYLWMEFHRNAGCDEWFSCGVRLSASQHNKSVDQKYFITGQRIGTPDGLFLTNDSGQPLSVKELQAAIGGHGEVCPGNDVYREQVRQRLYGDLNRQRYDSLINALLQLRTPKLSQRLDPQVLSTLLSKALPPLQENEIAELADGFERLDRRSELLRDLDRQCVAANKLSQRQRSYAQRVLRASAAQVISAVSDMDTATRVVRENETKIAAATDLLAEQEEQLRHDRVGQDACRNSIDELKHSEAYRQGALVDDRCRQAEQAESDAAREHVRLVKQQQLLARERSALDDARGEFNAEHRRSVDLARRGSRAADSAGMPALHAELVSLVDTDETGHAAKILRAGVAGRNQQIDEVSRAITAHRNAVDQRGREEDRRDRAQHEHETALDEIEKRGRAHQEERDRLSDTVAAWAHRCVELSFSDDTVDRLVELVDSRADLHDLVHRAAETVTTRLTRDEVAATQQCDTLRREENGLRADREALQRQRVVAPDPPHTRTAPRDGRPGAPLWQLIRFRGNIAVIDQAAVEAALESAGLLDAWVSPHGRLEVDGHDSFIVDPSNPAPAESLLSIMEPESETAVAPKRVRELLASIGWGATVGDGTGAVGADGSWRFGPLQGSWSKPEPAYIGAVARERHRQARIAELDGRLAGLGGRINELAMTLDLLAQRKSRLQTERRAMPSTGQLETLADQLGKAELTAGERARSLAATAHDLTIAEQRATDADLALAEVAGRHRLPRDPTDMEQSRRALADYHDQVRDWLSQVGKVGDLAHQVDSASYRAEQAGEQLDDLVREHAEADAKAVTLRRQADELAATVGKSFEEVRLRIDDLRSEDRQYGERIERTMEVVKKLTDTAATLRAKQETAIEQRDALVDRRNQVADRFRDLAHSQLWVDARFTDDVPDGVKAILHAARSVAVALERIRYEPADIRRAENQLRDSVHNERGALSQYAELELRTDGEDQLLTASVDGARISAVQLHDRLADERQRAKQELTDDEQDLFTRILTGQTRTNLAIRIREADALVSEMNARVSRVRTASNVAVQLKWQVRADLEASAKEARDLLLRRPEQLSADESQALQNFLRHRIESMRDSQDPQPWREQLRQVFDYTQWHEFVVRIDRGAGWQILTKKLHDALSGGEKSIALHLPLFAAVAAHYQTAPSAPRLILLDEVFVGVDTRNRGQIFALMASLDLDMVLTSDHEFCNYPELDGIAIHTIAGAADDDDAVTTVRQIWDGRHRVDTDEDVV